MLKKYLSLSFLNPSLSKTISSAFTLIEMMIVVVILWIWLLWVISTLSHSYKFLYNTKNKVSAINIARWWVEQVFNIRNTNWQRWWGKKDQCWLKVNPLVDTDNDGCQNDDWFSSWSYTIVSTWTNQKYFSLVKQNTGLYLDGEIESTDWNFLLCKNSDGIVSACSPTVVGRPTNYFDTILYFEQVRWGYLLDKQASNPNPGDWENISCDSWEDPWCGDWRALEKNFCVDVVYFDWDKFKVSFCSVLTNFKN